MAKKNKDSNQQADNTSETTNNNIQDFQKGFTPKPEKNIPFPASYATDPRVYIEEDTYKEIIAHSTETTSVELCGVLIGEVRFDVSGNYLYICGSIRGEKSKNSGVNVSFTPETWDYIHEEREKKYPDYAIIGWYHTHPGFGIFLSDMDKFIQDYFFNMPYQVALVVDPKSSEKGIFAWQDGKIRPLKNCWIGKEQTPLAIGTVGGEETYRGDKEPKSNVIPFKLEKKSSEEQSEESFYSKAFMYLLCLLTGFVLANVFYAKITQNYIEYFGKNAAQAEAREIIGSWAKDYSVSYDLDNITKFIDEYQNSLNVNSATNTIDLSKFNEFASSISNFLKIVSNNSKICRNRATEIIKNIAERGIQNHEEADKNLEIIKQMVASSILLQLEPYLTSLSAQPINETRIKEAKKMLEYIMSLYPEDTKAQIRQKYPWIFQ